MGWDIPGLVEKCFESPKAHSHPLIFRSILSRGVNSSSVFFRYRFFSLYKILNTTMMPLPHCFCGPSQAMSRRVYSMHQIKASLHLFLKMTAHRVERSISTAQTMARSSYCSSPCLGGLYSTDRYPIFRRSHIIDQTPEERGLTPSRSPASTTT